MLLYDISREVFSAPVYDGDPKPKLTKLSSIGDDSMYNLSAVSMCCHTGTHIDAPLHFDEDGADIASMRLSHFCGKCTVVTIDGILTGEDMERLLPLCQKRLILHGSGKAYLSVSAARVIADSKLLLVGTDAVSIAPPFDEAARVDLVRDIAHIFFTFVGDDVESLTRDKHRHLDFIIFHTFPRYSF